VKKDDCSQQNYLTTCQKQPTKGFLVPHLANEKLERYNNFPPYDRRPADRFQDDLRSRVLEKGRYKKSKACILLSIFQP